MTVTSSVADQNAVRVSNNNLSDLLRQVTDNVLSSGEKNNINLDTVSSTLLSSEVDRVADAQLVHAYFGLGRGVNEVV